MDIANIIKMGRIKKKMSQDDLGKKLGISKNSVSSWETGQKLPSCEMLLRVATELDIVEEIFPGYKKQDPQHPHTMEDRINSLEYFMREIGKKLDMYGINISNTINHQSNGFIAKG